MNPEDIKKAIETAYREGFEDGYREVENQYEEYPPASQRMFKQDQDVAWTDSDARCFTENGVR